MIITGQRYNLSGCKHCTLWDLIRMYADRNKDLLNFYDVFILIVGIFQEVLSMQWLSPFLKRKLLTFLILVILDPLLTWLFLSEVLQNKISPIIILSLPYTFKTGFRAAQYRNFLVKEANDQLTADADKCLVLILLDHSSTIDTVHHGLNLI